MESLSDEEIAQDLCQLLSRISKRTLPKLKSINVTRWFSNPYQLGVYRLFTHFQMFQSLVLNEFIKQLQVSANRQGRVRDSRSYEPFEA